jgi:hypothetical protein
LYQRWKMAAVDPATGKSITELELDEAERSLSAGTLTDILLYWLDEDANRPPRLCETDRAAIMRLKALREHSRQHTYTTFRDPRDLPYFVIRDVLAKLASPGSSGRLFCRCPFMSRAAYLPFPLFPLRGTVRAFDHRSRLSLSCFSAFRLWSASIALPTA